MGIVKKPSFIVVSSPAEHELLARHCTSDEARPN
jgi:hypothetical protein